MKNKFFLLISLILSLYIPPAFAFIIVQDPSAIANQVLQLMDSGSTLQNIITNTQETIRLGQSMYQGFKKMQDADGNVYDMLSAAFETGIKVSSNAAKLLDDYSGTGFNQDALNRMNNVLSSGSDIVSAIKYNVDYSNIKAPTGHWNSQTGEYVWETNYNLKLPTRYDIKKLNNAFSTTSSKIENDKLTYRQSLLDEKKALLEELSKVQAKASNAGEDIATNTALQTTIQSLESSLANVEHALEQVQLNEQKMSAEIQKINENLNFQNAIMDINAQLNASHNEIISRQQAIEAATALLDQEDPNKK